MPGIDFNSRLKPGDRSAEINAEIDRRMLATPRPARDYLGASSIADACARRIQYRYLKVPPDRPEFEARILRIFARGHALERVAIDVLAEAGFDLATKVRDGGQIGFSAAGGRFRGHCDGIVFAAPVAMRLPCLWEHKGLGAAGWRRVSTVGVAVAYPEYAGQIALYQAYLDEAVPGVGANPALFTATNADTMELYHEMLEPDLALAQRLSDRAVAILRACDGGTLMPRVAAAPDHRECQDCAWSATCWKDAR